MTISRNEKTGDKNDATEDGEVGNSSAPSLHKSNYELTKTVRKIQNSRSSWKLMKTKEGLVEKTVTTLQWESAVVF